MASVTTPEAAPAGNGGPDEGAMAAAARVAPRNKPALSVFQIWNMCFGFFGVQVGFALQNANVSRIFQTLGAEVEAIPILWIAAPLTGLLVQPIIGHYSDKTWGRMGRRRPYFFWGAICTTLALFVMPNSPYLWVAAGMLWIMDASINVTMEPFRAFVGDMLPHRQRTTGFAMQSFFIGAGAVFASALPWMLANWFGVENVAGEGAVPLSVKIAFYVGAACVLVAVMWTVFTTKEYPPSDLAAFEAAEPPIGVVAGGAPAARFNHDHYFRWGGISLIAGGVATILVAPFMSCTARIPVYVLLTVLLFPDPSQETITVNITYLVGSLHEGYGETGMAHLLEHLLFKGSTNHPDIPQELTAHGTRANGTTWTDRTNYYESFAATDENLEWALDLESDRMMNSFIREEDLDSEMTVVRNEFEIGENDPSGILNERIYATAYLWHNYGNTTIGARSDIENVPIENLRRFYETWYRPDNAVLVVAGKIDEAKTLSLIDAKFGPLEAPDIPLPQVYTEEPAQDGERSVTLRRVGDVAVAAAAYHIPSGSHPDHPAVRILSFLLADEPSGLLHRELVESKKATDVSARPDRWRDPGLLYVEAEVRKDGDVAAVQQEMIDLVESFAATTPSEEEVERAKTDYLRGFERSMRNPRWSAIGLTEWAAAGDWRLMFLYRDRVEAVTPEDVQRAAEAYLVSANRTSGLYIPSEAPERVEVPARPDVAAMLEGYEGREAMAAGEVFDPTPENIEARVTRKDVAPGIDLVLLPKATRGETVHLALNLHMGTEESLAGKATVGSLTAAMLMRGTENRTRQEIEDELTELRSSLSVWGGAQSATISIESTRENFPSVVELMADVLRNPAFPGSELDQLKEERIARAEEQRSDPRSLARITLYRHMTPYPPDHPNYVTMPEEEIEAIDDVSRGDLEKFHARFYGVDTAELAVVGDFDPEALEAQLAELFGDFDAPEEFARIATPYAPVDAIFESVETPDKESAVFMSATRMPIQDDHEDHPALTLASYIAGGGFLNSRLATRIRRTDGLSYGVGARYNASSYEPDAWFTGFAIYAPQNDEALVRAFWEELQKIENAGFTAEEVVDARNGWLQRQRLSRSQDRELASRLARYERIDRTLAWDAELETTMEALTPDDLHQAWKEHVDLGTISIVRGGDFSRVKTAELATP